MREKVKEEMKSIGGALIGLLCGIAYFWMIIGTVYFFADKV